MLTFTVYGNSFIVIICSCIHYTRRNGTNKIHFEVREHLLYLKSQRPQHGSVESSDNEVGIRVARMSIDKGKDAQGNHRDKKGFKEQKNGEPPVQGKIILYTVIQKASAKLL
jgi:hypothetical protein